MAGGSFFALLDDIASLLDDVSLMTKVAAKKTAGVVGDDLALNAKGVQGIAAARELPVVWAVMKGSFVNKLILVPVALGLSAFASFLIQPLLMLGGAYLCYEGAEKILHSRKAHGHSLKEEPKAVDERDKIRGAVRTDFILSAEIIVIALGTLDPGTAFVTRLLVLSLIAFGMTVGVYGLVALLVKLDDLGLALVQLNSAPLRRVGRGIVVSVPWIMKTLSVAGTVAMFMVGGGIVLHGIPGLHAPEGLVGLVVSALAGVLLGFIVVGVATAGQKVFQKKAA